MARDYEVLVVLWEQGERGGGGQEGESGFAGWRWIGGGLGGGEGMPLGDWKHWDDWRI